MLTGQWWVDTRLDFWGFDEEKFFPIGIRMLIHYYTVLVDQIVYMVLRGGAQKWCVKQEPKSKCCSTMRNKGRLMQLHP